LRACRLPYAPGLTLPAVAPGARAPHLHPLSLHDALPIFAILDGRAHITRDDWRLAGIVYETSAAVRNAIVEYGRAVARARQLEEDRKSTRLNSSHVKSSYAGFCLKKKSRTRRSAARRGRP